MFSRILIKNLSAKARKITDYLEKNRAKAVMMNIVKFAKQMNVHPSFVTKTLKRVGYNGWKDWVSFALRDIAINIPNSNYLKYIEKTLFTGIKNTLNRIDMVRLNMLISQIHNRRYNEIIFTGHGYSLYIAQDQCQRYNLINYPAKYIDEKLGAINAISVNSLIVVISISGYTSITNKQLDHLASEKRCKLILVSGAPVQKVHPAFDFAITTSLYDNKGLIENKVPSHTRIIIFTILDMIYWKIFKKHLAQNNKYLEMLKEH